MESKSYKLDASELGDMIYRYHSKGNNQMPEDVKHRFATYDFCHSYFVRNRKKLLSSHMEESCIRLWSFLGSWGMLRGSSQLIKENSPASLKPVIECIANTPEEIWNIDVEQYKEKQQDLIKLYESIEKALIEGSSKKDCDGKPLKTFKPTCTLITKVMMGVFGIVPAFDTFFCKTFGDMYPQKGFTSYHFGKNALNSIYEFYKTNKEAIDAIKIPVMDFDGKAIPGLYYKKAKLIDMYGFTSGEHSAEKEKAEKKK